MKWIALVIAVMTLSGCGSRYNPHSGIIVRVEKIDHIYTSDYCDLQLRWKDTSGKIHLSWYSIRVGSGLNDGYPDEQCNTEVYKIGSFYKVKSA